MASLYRSARSELRRAEAEWRAQPRLSFDLHAELNRPPHWLSAVVIAAIGTAFLLTVIFGVPLLHAVAP